MTRTAKRVARQREPRSDPTVVRVACYCRLSVTERGETQFTSIEALHAYVASQHALGWRVSDQPYQDDGYSGGTTERPAFLRLLEDARSGRVDAVAVVRFDRLSRRQIDFLQTLEELDTHGVEFVSITQNLDTSTAMGRCNLGVMGAFAELERATISERTSAKMVASRRRGMWTGGRPVLGYDVVDKRLVINQDEAEHVRAIYQLYLDQGGVVAVVEELRLRGTRNKCWTTKTGAKAGGNAFDKNTVASMLKSPLYVGDVRAGDEVVPGEHEGIVAREVWHAVQRQLAAQAPNVPARATKRSTALLSGIARCKCGAAMTRSTAKRHGRTYSYYACASAVKNGRTACPGSRVATGVLEKFVIERIREIGRDPAVLEAAITADRDERGVERARLDAELQGLRTGRGKHAGERARVVAAVGAGDAPQELVTRVGELDALVAEADARVAGLERDLAALEGQADIEALRAALEEFDGVWTALDQGERARILALVLDEVVVDGRSGEAELRFRGAS
jgi:site-specific DNA recombinase